MTKVIVVQQWELWYHCWKTLLCNNGTDVIVGTHCCTTITSDHISTTMIQKHCCVTTVTAVIARTHCCATITSDHISATITMGSWACKPFGCYVQSKKKYVGCAAFFVPFRCVCILAEHLLKSFCLSVYLSVCI
jgi:hypothetical protein